MTWEEVSEALKETDIVIIPVGSVEQHGLHLPLGADSIQGTEIVKRVVEKLEKEKIKVIAAPTIPFGLSRGHMKFPGTITLTPQTLSLVIKEVVHSLYAHGFRKFALVLAHGGNLGILNLTASELSAELPDAYLIVPNWLPVMETKYPDILHSDRPKDEHHSGEGETARMLASTPNLVRMDRAKVYYTPADLDPYQPRSYPGPVARARGDRGMKEMTSIGSMGNPTIATKETGEKVYNVIVDWLCTVIKAEFVKT
jgi:creatinine amidohydrolase